MCVFELQCVHVCCLGCHLKCHKEHVDRADSVMQPCVGGERDVKRVLLLISNDEDRGRWLNRLSQITIAKDDSSLKPPSPPYVVCVCVF